MSLIRRWLVGVVDEALGMREKRRREFQRRKLDFLHECRRQGFSSAQAHIRWEEECR